MSKRWSVGLLGLLLLFLAACSQTVQTPTPGAEENLAAQACTRTWPIVKRSSSSQSNAKIVQYLLRNRGYSLTVDGYFGSDTESAVKSFQRSKGLSQDGIVGTNTWSALIATVQQGSNNNAVRAVQFKLGISIDGIFGSGTKSSVINFQRSKGLFQDGIVGPNTWAALVGGSVNCSGSTSPSGTRAQLAQQILNSSRISLLPYSPVSSKTTDGADARSNIRDTAAGRTAKRSSYGNAPGGSVYLDTRMLTGMLKVGNTYSFRVNSIVGGSHSVDLASLRWDWL